MTFSVVVPTFNRCESLARTLASIAKVDFPPDDYEILVVDNGSVDATRQAFEQVRSDHPRHNWKYLEEPVPGPMAARHRAIPETRGEILAFTDDDVRVDRWWLDGIVRGFRRADNVRTPWVANRRPLSRRDTHDQQAQGSARSALGRRGCRRRVVRIGHGCAIRLDR